MAQTSRLAAAGAMQAAIESIYAYDTNGNVVGLSGYPVVSTGYIKAGAIGDSTVAGVLQSVDGITVQVGNNYTSVGAPQSIGYERGANTAWLTHLCLLSNGRLVNNHNGGVSGDTSAGCLSRLAYEISQAPNIMFMQMGIRNDINSYVPTETSKANVITAITQVKKAGILPILVCCLPDNTSAIGTAIRAWNEWLKWYGFTNNIMVIDPFSAVTDVTSATCNWLAIYSGDGVHPNGLGSQVVAQYMLKQLVSAGIIQTIPDATSFHRLANTDLGFGIKTSDNLLFNPLFRQNTGAVTGTSWTNIGTNSPSINVTPGTGVLGYSQVITFAATNTLSRFDQQITTVVGKRYAFSGLFKTSGMVSTGTVYNIGVIAGVGAPTNNAMVIQSASGIDYTNFTPFYIEFIAKSTATRVAPFTLPTTASGNCTLECAMLRFVCITDL